MSNNTPIKQVSGDKSSVNVWNTPFCFEKNKRINRCHICRLITWCGSDRSISPAPGKSLFSFLDLFTTFHSNVLRTVSIVQPDVSPSMFPGKVLK